MGGHGLGIGRLRDHRQTAEALEAHVDGGSPHGALRAIVTGSDICDVTVEVTGS